MHSRGPASRSSASAPTASASRPRFKNEYGLPFTLLADPDHAVTERYGFWAEKSFAGKKHTGVERSTFVIDADGNVAKIMRRVNPDRHADEVLAALT